MLLHNTTVVVLITLGFMTLGVWHKQDSGIQGGGQNICLIFSNERAQK